MADYKITLARSARKELENLPVSLAERILEKIEALSVTPRPSGSIKLHGEKNLWRIRIGDYRVVYAIFDSAQLIDVSIIRHRREVYRSL